VAHDTTFIGGGDSYPTALALHPDGSVVMVGLCVQLRWPTTPGAYKSVNDQWDGFVARLDATGSSLVASTLLGAHGFGTSHDYCNAVAIDERGYVTVAGMTVPSTGLFPTTPGAYATTFKGGWSDAFVTRLDPAFSRLVYSTLLGSSDYDQALAVTLTDTGSAVVAGVAGAFDFPTTPGVVGPVPSQGPGNGFITRLDPTGSRLEFSTFISSQMKTGSVWSVALDRSERIYVMGETWTSLLPTTPGASTPTAGASRTRS
jgi:hypothetical protein